MTYVGTGTSGVTWPIEIDGELYNREDKDLKGWEFGHAHQQVNRLSQNVYPITWLKNPEGTWVTLIYGDHQCKAAFHRLPAGAKYGPDFWIGSSTLLARKNKLDEKEYRKQFRDFVSRFGISIGIYAPPVAVKFLFYLDYTVQISKKLPYHSSSKPSSNSPNL